MPKPNPQRKYDARPDRADFRDRLYDPPLKSLPQIYPDQKMISEYLPKYSKNILDQGKEGSCTGHGLAALINYTQWEAWIKEGSPKKTRPNRVSPFMLYHNARLYDEWEGDDYEGSSCRGAMKGWHKHGVCSETIWPATKNSPQEGWGEDAATRPLGAYYRVNAKSIQDMQAAICEVHAVYCSADVHAGWDRPAGETRIGKTPLKMIVPQPEIDGGHAFSLVGYNSDGFIVQNSWGPAWGTGGFALLTYEDWIKNGNDAWVAALGAPMRMSGGRISPQASQRSGLGISLASGAISSMAPLKHTAAQVPMWSEDKAYQHAIVMGNDGKLLRRIVGATNARDSMDIVLSELIIRETPKKLAIYVHGGLNDEEAAIKRVRRMGPWFEVNGIYPLFVIWRTGLMESLKHIAQDDVRRYEEEVAALRAKGLGDLAKVVADRMREAFDRTFEVAAEKVIGKAVWSQIKQNAERAATSEEAGIAILVKKLAKLQSVDFHLLGHSAGAIMIGHLLRAARGKLTFNTCELYAPACTVEFASSAYGGAFDDGTLKTGGMGVHLMTNDAELRDGVGPYGKSLLYLVSRALEDTHKTPLLGLEIAWNKDGKGAQMELNRELHSASFPIWQKVVQRHGVKLTRYNEPKRVSRIVPTRIEIDLSHGSFDNDIKVVSSSLKKLLGEEPAYPVTDLSGF